MSTPFRQGSRHLHFPEYIGVSVKMGQHAPAAKELEQKFI